MDPLLDSRKHTYRVDFDHVRVPCVETHTNIVIAKVSLGSGAKDVSVLGGSNKAVHRMDVFFGAGGCPLGTELPTLEHKVKQLVCFPNRQ